MQNFCTKTLLFLRFLEFALQGAAVEAEGFGGAGAIAVELLQGPGQELRFKGGDSGGVLEIVER